MNANIPPFYKGQKVVYITGNNMPKNSIHTVLDCFLDYCGKCWVVLIETTSSYKVKDVSDYTYVECNDCKSSVSKDLYLRIARNGIWDAKSFRPVQEAKMIRVSFEKIIEEIPVIAN